jgi:hypothetical protein
MYIGNFKDPTVGSVSDSESRKPTGFSRMVGPYKIRYRIGGPGKRLLNY